MLSGRGRSFKKAVDLGKTKGNIVMDQEWESENLVIFQNKTERQ